MQKDRNMSSFYQHSNSNTSATLTPINAWSSRLHLNSMLRTIAQSDKRRKLSDLRTIKWLPALQILVYTKPLLRTMLYKYFSNADGSKEGYEVRCSILGELMKPATHWNPNKTSSYFIEKFFVRLTFAITSAEEDSPDSLKTLPPVNVKYTHNQKYMAINSLVRRYSPPPVISDWKALPQIMWVQLYRSYILHWSWLTFKNSMIFPTSFQTILIHKINFQWPYSFMRHRR